ncbi:Ig-like domain repeat protein [Variovorax sp. CY25R-8]|uniref:Ig-like domain repeat protein n=1 Tax=Variovorax sp. CY25R-8 TaxID=2855501 RepID=UPI0021BAE070|nr:Ig-like domain repeat protein [Variovorax sp. CY25R-8]MCT8176736.1 Ig-like domain repeat protein [Variovorax sp. CY25R-8]
MKKVRPCIGCHFGGSQDALGGCEMVAIVSGNSLGLSLTSLGVLGQRGTSGTAGQGRNGELAYVNVANGNLVLQDLDDKLVGRGADIGVVRTYNSQGLLNDSTLDPNADNWLLGAFGQRMVLTGTVGTAGSTLTRTDRDGASAIYTWNASRSLYVSSAGSGAFDTIAYDAAAARYIWTDGATGLVERYESTGAGRLMTVVDLAGNTITYSYNSTSGLLQSMVDANGETTYFDYDASNNLTQIRTVATGGATTTRVRYAYDSARRLSTVTVDLSPEDNAVTDGKTYVTTYGYDGTSKRVASVTQRDGTSLAFTYVLAGGSYKVATVTDALGQVTRFAYDTVAGTTTVTDPLGAQSTYLYAGSGDAQGQLLQMRRGVTAANPSGLSQISYRYDAAGNVTGMTDGEGREVAYEYDANGNLLKETDSAGNLHTRSYNAANQLLTEIFYADAAVSRGAFSQPASLPEITRYVYAQSNPRLLRFVLSPQGDVTEHRYDSYGQAVATIRYTGGGYNVAALAAGAVPTEAQMITWVGSSTQDLRRTERIDRVYDARGALSSSTTYGEVDTTGAGVAASAAKTQYVYDQHGWLLKTIEPTGGGTTTYVYDGLGRVLSVSAPSLDGGTTANTTVTSYDDAGGKTTVTVAGGLVSISAYDKAGRLVSVTQQSAGTGVLGATKYAYDKDGNLLMTQDPTGVRQWMLYDAAGRKIADIDATGALVEYVYNANGQLRQTVAYATKLTTAKLASLVDGVNQPTTAWSATNTTTSLAALRPGQVAQQDQKVWRFYDNAGRLAWQVDALGYVTETTYDGASRIVSVTQLANPIDVAPLTKEANVDFVVDPVTIGGITLSLNNAGSTPLGQVVVLTATVDGASAGGMVSFFDGETVIGSALVIDGNAVLMTDRLSIGTHSLRVAYSGDEWRLASVSKAVNKTIAPAATSARLDFWPSTPITYGQTVTMSVTLTTLVLPGLAPPATGEVRFYNGNTLIGMATVINGLATLTTSSLPVGASTIRAEYAGDMTHTGAISSQTITVGLAPTVTKLESVVQTELADPSKGYDPFLLVASVKSRNIDFSFPIGSVTFYSGGTVLGTATLVNGVAALQMTPEATRRLTLEFLGATGSPPPFRAMYSGDAINAPSGTLDASGQTLASPTTIKLVSDLTETRQGGGAVNLTAYIDGVKPGGLVTFFAGTILLGTSTVHNYSASFGALRSSMFLPAGTYVLSAVYSGDASNQASVIAQGPTLQVSEFATSVGLGETLKRGDSIFSPSRRYQLIFQYDGNLVVYDRKESRQVVWNTQTAFSKEVRPGYTSASGAPYKVSFQSDGNLVVYSETAITKTGSWPDVPVWNSGTSGKGASQLRLQDDGNLVIYKADGTALWWSGVDTVTGMVTPGWTPEWLPSELPPAVRPDIVIVTATNVSTSSMQVNASVSGAPSATGTFSFFSGQTLIASRPAGTGSVFTLPLLPLGTHSLTVVYSGDANNAAASGVLQLNVQPAATNLSLSTSRMSAVVGAPLTFSAKVSRAGTWDLNSPPLGGTVTFYRNGIAIGTASVINDVASLTVSDLSLGTNDITASYSGTTNYKSANANLLSQQVWSSTATTTLSASPSASAWNAPITLTASVVGNGGIVDFYDGAVLLGSVAVTNGSASLVTSSLSVGAHTIQAIYSKDAALISSSVVYVNVGVTTLTNLTTPSIAKDGALSVRITGKTPTGLVSFYSGTTLLGTVVVLSDGTATLRGVPIPAGTHTFSAVYSGDALNADGAITFTQTVTGTSTPTVLVGLDAGQDRTATQLYNRNGQLQGTLDAEGYLTEYKYNAAGEQVQTIRYASRAANFASVSARMMAVAIARASGDLKGLRPVDTSPDDICTYSFYNARGQLVGQVDGEGYFTETTYDLRGNVTQTKRYLKPAKSPAAAGATLATVRPDTDPLDQVVSQTWSAANQLLSRTNVEGTVTSFSYDAAGRLVQTSTAAGTTDERISRQRYDVQGRLIGELDGRGSAAVALADPLSAWSANGTTHAYDAAGRRTSTTDANGHRTLFFYDALGRLTYSVNALGEVTENRYDALGQVSDLIVYGTPVNLSTLGATTPGGLNTSTLKTLIDAVDDTAKDRHTVNRYNATGTLASSSDAVTATTNNLTSYSYNAFREVTASSQTRANGQVVSNTIGYDRRGLKTSSTADATGVAAGRSIGYDAFGRATTRVDGNGNATSIAYDRLGRVVTTTDATGAKRVTTYDAFDRVLTQRDALNNTTTYAYNLANRSVTVTTPEGVGVTTVHNRHGQTLSVKDGRGNTTSYVYDKSGNLLQTQAPESVGTSATYDKIGLKLTTTDARGTVTSYAYDAADRLLTRTVDAAGLALVATYKYDTSGQKISVTDPGGTVTSYKYDLDGQLLQETVDPSNGAYVGLNLQTTYTYDVDGTTLSVLGPDGRLTRYTYDGAGRRIKEQVDPLGLNLTRGYDYDGEGNLVRATDGNGNATLYVYDKANRKVFTIDAMGGVRQTSYDDEGRVSAETSYAAAMSLANLQGVAPSLDAMRALLPTLGAAAIQRRRYDRDGRLRFTVDGAGGVVEYKYDAGNNLVETRGYAKPIDLTAWDPTKDPVVVADDSHDQRTRNVYDNLGRKTYTVDGTGAVVKQVYDANGNVIDRFAYGARIPLTTALTPTAIDSAVTTAMASATAARTERDIYVYDRANRQTSHTDGVGTVTAQSFDKNGNVTNRSYWNAQQAGTNLLTQSELANGVGDVPVKGGVVTAASMAGFKGAVKLERDPNGPYSYAYKTVATTAGSTYTLSVIVEMEDGLPPTFASANTASGSNSFTLVLFSFFQDPTKLVTQDLGGGRYRVSVTGVAPASPGVNFGVIKQTGNDARAFRVSGYQLEQASVSGNLTSTTTTAITAAADAKSQVTRLAYDSAGRLVYTLGPLGQLEKNSYDAAGRVTLVTRYAKAINTTSLGAAPTLAQLDALVQANTNLFTQSEFVNGLVDAPSKTGVVSVATMTGLGGALRIAPDPSGPYSLVYKTLATTPGTTYTLSMIVEMEDGLAPAFGNPTVNTAGNSFGMVMFGAGVATNKYVVQSLGNGRYRISTTAVAPAAPGLNFGVVKYTANDARPFRISGFQLEQAAAAGTYVETTTASTAAKDQLQHSVYDKAGRLVASVDALGNTVKYTLDGNGSVSEKRAFYNPVNMASWVPGTVPAPTASDTLDQRTRSFYDPTGRESLTVDALGYAVQRQYDAQGRLSAIVRYPVAIPAATAVTQQAQLDAAIKLASTSGRALQITVYGYDAAGQRISETTAFGQPEAAVTRYVYDGVGRLTRTIDPRGGELSLSDSAWALQQRKLLKYTNAAGGALKAVDLTPAQRDALAALYTTVNDYDAAGHKISVTDGLSGITRSDYDANGNVVKITDPRGNAAFYYFDAAGRVTLSVDPEGYATATSYDMFGQTLSIKRYFGRVTGTYSATQAPALPGTNASDALTRFEYDAAGRLSRTIDAESNAERYTYNALGQRETLTNKLGGVTTYAYDRLGRVVGETLPITSKNASGQAVAVVNQTTYDAFGNKLTTTEAAGLPEQRVTTYGYDGLNRQVSVRLASVSIYTAASGWATAAPTRTSSYDASGNLIVAVDANGGRTRNWFDAGNRKVAEVSATGTLSTWVYDAAGNVMEQNVYGDVLALPVGDALPVPVNAANVRTTTYQVDANNRVTSSTIAQVEFGEYNAATNAYHMNRRDLIRRSFHDSNGNVLRQVDGRGGAITNWYDKLGQKVLEVDAMGYGVRWERDANGAVFRETRFAKGIDLGSMSESTPMSTVLALFKSNPDDQITDYTYDRNGRMLSESRLGVAYGSVNATTGALAEKTAAATKRYGYDAMGNRTSVTDALSQRTDLAYDRLGRLLSERKPAALVDSTSTGNAATSWRQTTEYEYDGLNNLRREIRRGADNTSEGDDQIVGYGYDATGVRTSMTTGKRETIRYGRDANGNTTAQMVDRLDADNELSNDIVSIAYDAANRETTRFTGTRDATNAPIYDISKTVTLGYNAWGELASRRTGSGNLRGEAQEYWDYDKAGRLWRTNSQKGGQAGVNKAWMYDLAGNATLQLESQRANLRAMSWEQMADDGTRPAPDILITITEYDQNNRAVSVKQPAMDASRPRLRMMTDPVDMESGKYGGLDIDVAPALAEADSTAILGPASSSAVAAVGQLGIPLTGGTAKSVTDAQIFGGRNFINPRTVGFTNVVLGEGGVDWTRQIENLYGQVSWRVEFVNAQFSYTYDLGRITSWPQTLRLTDPRDPLRPGKDLFLPLNTVNGTQLRLVAVSDSLRAPIVMATRTLSQFGATVTTSVFGASEQRLSGTFLRLATSVNLGDSIALYSRAQGAGPFERTLPVFRGGEGGSSLNGAALEGWYLTRLDNLAQPSELLLVITHADGSVARRDSILWNPATRTLTTSAAPAKPVFTSDNVGHFTGLRINGSAIRVLQRPLGKPDQKYESRTYWPEGAPGTFNVAFDSGASDVIIEVLDLGRGGGEGVVVDRLKGIIDPRTSRYEMGSLGAKPSSITFRDIPTDAQTLEITYEPLSPGGKPKATISIPRKEAGGVTEWVWDASSLVLDPRNLYSYKLSFVARDGDGFIVTDATGEVTIGAISREGTKAKLTGNVKHQVLVLDPGVPEGRTLNLRYREKGAPATEKFIEAAATRSTITSNGQSRIVFKWDATDKKLDPAKEYEFLYEVRNAADAVIASGEGYFRPDNDPTNDGSYLVARWAIPNLPDNEIVNNNWVIQRRQTYDAFDQVVTEKDGKGNLTELRYNTQGLLTDKIGPMVEVTQADGQKTRIKPTDHYSYDLNGQLVGKRDANGYQSTVELDAAGQAVAEWHPGSSTGTSAGRLVAVRKTYDLFGNLVTVSDELKRLTRNIYDANDRLIKVERPVNVDGSRAFDAYEYDILGQRIARTNALKGFKERTYYDSQGRVSKFVSAENAIISYGYAFDSSVSSAGGVNTGGWINTTTNANGMVQTLKNDVFGRLMWKQDYGGHQFTYGYNWSGLIETQIGVGTGAGNSGQDIRYSYYDNGYLREVIDRTTRTTSKYEYDKNGNRVRESIIVNTQGALLAFQQSEVVYDEYNRVKTIKDSRYVIDYEYDANGNRRRMHSIYLDIASSSSSPNKKGEEDYWYAYDGMNRFTVTMGQIVGGQIVRGSSGDGVAIEYDDAGQRKTAIYARDGHREDYAYDGAGNLTTVRIDSALASNRVNDLAGRVVRYEEFGANGMLSLRKERTWNLDNQLTKEVEGRFNALQLPKSETTTTYTLMKDGTLAATGTVVSDFEKSTVSGQATAYQYEWWDSAKQKSITLAPLPGNTAQPGAQYLLGFSEFVYDANGNLKTATDRNPNQPRAFEYWSDAQGQVLMRQELIGAAYDPKTRTLDTSARKSREHRYFYFDGKRVGNVGNDGIEREDYAQQLARNAALPENPDNKYHRFKPISAADFDENYQPINADFPGAAPGSYTVREGDTLERVARALWGDATLWYLLAEANGLDGQPSAPLVSNTVLVIPNKVTNLHNTSETFRPYNPGRVMGETSPALPDPLPPPRSDREKCGGFGQIIVAVVAVVASIYTAGAAASALAPAGSAVAATTGFSATMSLGASAMVGTAGLGFGVGIAAASIGGAVGSIASQAVGIGIGVQDSFDWKGVLQGALGAGVSAGLGGWIQGGGLGKALADSGRWGTAGRLAVTNIATQGLSIATGLQKGFDWRGVAASAASGYVSVSVGEWAQNAKWSVSGQRMVRGMAGGLVSTAVRGGSLSRALPGIVGDVIGSTIGNAPDEHLARAMEKSAQSAGGAEAAVTAVEIGPGLNDNDWSSGASIFNELNWSRVPVGTGFSYAGSPGGIEVWQENAAAALFAAQSSDTVARIGREKNDESMADASIRSALYRLGEDDASVLPVFKIYGGGSVHESITEAAARMAGVEYDSVLRKGVRWPDVPSRKPNSISYGGLILDLEKPGTLTYESHYGSRQYWHSMVPSDGSYTNKQVLEKIVDQAKSWYQASVSEGNIFHVGKVLHMVQDSYSQSHVVRNSVDDVIVFQSYQDQDSHQHGSADSIPKGGTWRDTPGVAPATLVSANILTMYKNRASVEVLESYLRENVYRFVSGAENAPAGGTAPAYQKPLPFIWYRKPI